jgi:hypothetical protein
MSTKPEGEKKKAKIEERKVSGTALRRNPE